MEQKKKIIAAILFAIAIISIGVVYYLFTSSGNTTASQQTQIDLEGEKFAKGEDWDTVSNKADMLEKLGEMEQKKTENQVSFDENVNDKNKITNSYGNPLQDAPEPKNNKSVRRADHASSLQTRLRNEVARDQPVQTAYVEPKNSAPKQQQVNQVEETDNGSFEFGGFVIQKNKPKTEPKSNQVNNSSPFVPENLIPEVAQASGVVSEKTKISTNAPLRITLTSDLKLPNAGVTIPKGSIITAVTNLSGSRVNGRIDGINLNGKIHKVYLNLYDNDGNEGLQVGGIKKDLNNNVKSGLDNVISSSTSGLGAGGQLLNGIFSSVNRNTNKTEAVIPDGYKVIIRE